jgi:hypothetical protein
MCGLIRFVVMGDCFRSIPKKASPTTIFVRMHDAKKLFPSAFQSVCVQSVDHQGQSVSPEAHIESTEACPAGDVAKPVSWKAALGLSCLAAYIPFILMALYALAALSCSHCKATAWKLLVPGPGLVPIELIRHWMNWPRLPDGLWFALGAIVAVCAVIGIARLARLGRAWLLSTAIIAFVLCSIAAVGLLGAIRS